MFLGPLPDVAALVLHASVVRHCGRWISATGVGTTVAQATLRHDSERAERCTLAGGAARLDVTGSAAGAMDDPLTPERAACELVERWLCRVWWAGHLPPAQPRPEAMDVFHQCLRDWPRRQPRHCALVALDYPGLQTVHVAWSCAADKRGLCFGMSAAPNTRESVQTSVREMLQMEFGLSIVRHKQAHDVALSQAEMAVCARADGLGVDGCAARLLPHRTMTVTPKHSATTLSRLAALGLSVEQRVMTSPVSAHKVVEVAVSRAALNLDELPTGRWPLYGVD